jgi:hypothetical protein
MRPRTFAQFLPADGWSERTLAGSGMSTGTLWAARLHQGRALQRGHRRGSNRRRCENPHRADQGSCKRGSPSFGAQCYLPRCRSRGSSDTATGGRSGRSRRTPRGLRSLWRRSPSSLTLRRERVRGPHGGAGGTVLWRARDQRGSGARDPGSSAAAISNARRGTPAVRERFFRAAYCFSRSQPTWRTSRSLSYISLINAIEVLTPVCCQPLPDLRTESGSWATARFRDIVERYAGDVPERKELYALRSRLVHGDQILISAGLPAGGSRRSRRRSGGGRSSPRGSPASSSSPGSSRPSLCTKRERAWVTERGTVTTKGRAGLAVRVKAPGFLRSADDPPLGPKAGGRRFESCPRLAGGRS